jgi:hypothetical protein
VLEEGGGTQSARFLKKKREAERERKWRKKWEKEMKLRGNHH